MEKYRFRLTWCGQKDTPELRAVIEHLKVFPLFQDSKARLISFEEYIALANANEIAPPESYWQVFQSQVGLISLDYYGKYSDTWERISTAKNDFFAGWQACKKNKK